MQLGLLNCRKAHGHMHWAQQGGPRAMSRRKEEEKKSLIGLTVLHLQAAASSLYLGLTIMKAQFQILCPRVRALT